MPDFAVRTAFTATDRISPAFRRMGGEADRFGRRGSRAMAMVSRAATAVGLIGGIELIRRGIMGIVGEAANLENAVADFTTLTGSVENARRTVQDLQTLGAATPFEFGDLSRASTTLLGFEAVTRENLVPTLRMLGDVSGGNADRLNRITLAFSQIRAGGRASMQDINQLINAGVPILGELGRMWGVTVGQARAMISTGRATGDAVTEAFRRMTAEGGRFHGGMERASRTLTGRFSTFIDNVKVAAAAIGTALLPQLKSALDYFIGLAESISKWATDNKEAIQSVFGAIAKALPYVIGGFIAYKTALMAVAFWHGVLAAIKWAKEMRDWISIWNRSRKAIGFYNATLKGTVIWETILAIKTKAVAIATGIFNAVLALNPIVWVVLGIVALVAAIVLLIRNWEAVKRVMIGVWDTIKRNVITAIDFLSTKMRGLSQTIMTILVTPTNLWIEAIIRLLQLASRIPGIGGTFARAAASAREFQTAALSAIGARNVFAPNEAATERRNINFRGEINIANAPEGTTATGTTRGAPPIYMHLVGANP